MKRILLFLAFFFLGSSTCFAYGNHLTIRANPYAQSLGSGVQKEKSSKFQFVGSKILYTLPSYGSGVTACTGILNGAVCLDGSERMVAIISNLPQIDADRSLSFWWNRSYEIAGYPMVDYGDWSYDPFYIVQLSGNLCVGHNGGGDSPCNNTGVPDSTWIHIVVTHQSVTGINNIYVNGQKFTDTRNFNTVLLDNSFGIGDAPQDQMFDELAIFDRVLSDTEALALYNAGQGLEIDSSLCSGLLALYHFNDENDLGLDSSLITCEHPSNSPLQSSGSLVFAQSYCQSFSQTGTGSSVCNEWDHKIQIPFLYFAVHMGGYLLIAVLSLALCLILVFYFLRSVIKYFWFRIIQK